MPSTDTHSKGPQPSSSPPVKKLRPAPELTELANQVGEFMANWGFKKVHGRVWVHLMVERVPLSAKDLMQRLHISKALTSMTINELLKYDVITAVGRASRGTVLYRANPDIMHAIHQVIRSREKRILARLDAAYRSLKQMSDAERAVSNISASRLRFVGHWVDAGNAALEMFQSGFNFDLSAVKSVAPPVEGDDIVAH